MVNGKFIVGVTGGIGSGKTAVCDWFIAQGIDVIDADKISHDLTKKGSPILQTLKQTFGDWILQNDELNRQALRQFVFQNPDVLKQLNAIMHPQIRIKIIQNLECISSDYGILCVPLLLENIKDDNKGLSEFCDRVLVVDVPVDVQIQRASQRDNQTKKDILAIINKQISRDRRLVLADDVVDNSGTLINLQNQLINLHQTYLKLAQKTP